MIACKLSLAGLALDISATTAESAWQNPVIQGHGKMHPMPKAEVQPSPDRGYKILYNVTRAAEAPDKVTPGSEHVARLINIYTLQIN
ncbi:MAG: hypothetical protein ACREUM_08575, partial [Nitrosospira sp.]